MARQPDEPKGQGRSRLMASNQTSRSLYLERRVYQGRRLVDAAKLLPVIGVLLFVVPALLMGTPGGPDAGASTAMRLVYFFFIWACLIATCAVIARGLAGGHARTTRHGPAAAKPPEDAG